MTLELIDAHVHLWSDRVSGLRWPFIDAQSPIPRARQLAQVLDRKHCAGPEFAELLSGFGVSQAVNVEAALNPDPSLETAWVQGQHDACGWPSAIVGACQLDRPDAIYAIDAQQEHRAFRGVRDLTAGPALTSPRVAHSASTLADRGFSLELHVAHTDFAAVGELARAVPELVVVLAHSGLRGHRADETFPDWERGIRALAREPNVVCKLSQLHGWEPDWTEAAVRPWAHTLVDAFGPDRCMYASDWPFAALVGGYEQQLDIFHGLLASYSETDRAAIFGRTARRVYRL